MGSYLYIHSSHPNHKMNIYYHYLLINIFSSIVVLKFHLSLYNFYHQAIQ